MKIPCRSLDITILNLEKDELNKKDGKNAVGKNILNVNICIEEIEVIKESI